MQENNLVINEINNFARKHECMEDSILAVVEIGSKESGLTHSQIWNILLHPINGRSWAELMTMEKDEALQTIFQNDSKSIDRSNHLWTLLMDNSHNNASWREGVWIWWKSVMTHSINTAPSNITPRQREDIFNLVARNSLVSLQQELSLWHKDIRDYMTNFHQFKRKVNDVTSLIPDNPDSLDKIRATLSEIQQQAIKLVQNGQIPILKMFDTKDNDKTQYWESLSSRNTYDTRFPQLNKHLLIDDVIRHTSTSLNSSFVSWSYASPMVSSLWQRALQSGHFRIGMSATSIEHLLWSKVSVNLLSQHQEKWKFYEGQKDTERQITDDERNAKSLEYWNQRDKHGVLVPSEYEAAIWGDLPIICRWER